MSNNIYEMVSTSISRSVQKVEELCPLGNVKTGLTSKDTYHPNGKVSLYTAAELLWALSECELPVHANYLVEEITDLLLNNLNKNINKDRILEEAFILWSLSLVNITTNNTTYSDLLKKILDKQFGDGSWGTCMQSKSNVRATALCVVALVSCCSNLSCNDPQRDTIKKSVVNALVWLISKFDNEYLWSYDKSLNFDKKTFVKDCKICLDKNSLVLYSFCFSINMLGDNLLQAKEFEKLKTIINKSIKILNKVNMNLAIVTSEIELEEYYVNNKLKKHDHGAGHLEFYILFILEHKHSLWLSPNNSLYTKLSKLIELVLSMEIKGCWNDKNTEYLDRMWTLSYGIKVLSAYQNECKNINDNNRINSRNKYQYWYKFWSVIKKPVVWIPFFIFVALGLSIIISNLLPEWLGCIGLALSLFPLGIEFVKLNKE